MRRMRHLKAREVQSCAIALDASRPSTYDATSGGSLCAPDAEVLRWEDQSGSGRHVTQSAAGKKPLYRPSAMNGLPAVDFDGNNYLSRMSENVLSYYDAAGTGTTVLAVQTQDGGIAANTTISLGDDNRIVLHATYVDKIYFDPGSPVSPAGRISVAQPTGWDNSAHVVYCTRDGANAYIASDNSVLATTSSMTKVVSSASATLGVGVFAQVPSLYHGGNISEVAVWARGISAHVSRRIWHSRQRKWRING